MLAFGRIVPGYGAQMLPLLLLALSPAHADSFLTSVDFARTSVTPLPTAGPCDAEVRALGPDPDALDHAAVLGACHGYDSNTLLAMSVSHLPPGALRDLDSGFVATYEATYETGAAAKSLGTKGASSVALAMKERPADARVWLVAALVLAQNDLFVQEGSWTAKTAESRRVVSIVQHAAQLNRAAPTPDFQPSLDAAVDYFGEYSVYAELTALHSQPASVQAPPIPRE